MKINVSTISWSAGLVIGIQLCVVAIVLPHFNIFGGAMAQTSTPDDGGKNLCAIILEKETEKKWDESYKICFKETGPLKVPEPASTNMTLEEYHDKFDDKCLFQCVYKNLELVTDAGGVKPKGAETAFKSNMTEEMMGKAIGFWDGCIGEAEILTKAKGSNPCKTIQLHMYCFSKKLGDEKFLRNLVSISELLANNTTEDVDDDDDDVDDLEEMEDTTIISLDA